MQEGPFRYKSAHAPVPLTQLEEALLVGAGAGFTGLAFWDLPTPAPYPRQKRPHLLDDTSGRPHRAVLDQRPRILCPRRQGRGQQAARGRNQGGAQQARRHLPRPASDTQARSARHSPPRATDERTRSLGLKPAGLHPTDVTAMKWNDTDIACSSPSSRRRPESVSGSPCTRTCARCAPKSLASPSRS